MIAEPPKTCRQMLEIDRDYLSMLAQFGLSHDEVKAAAAADRVKP